MNFEYSLENGKYQLKTGLMLLALSIILGVLTAILIAVIPNNTARLVVGIIFSLGSAVATVFTAIKLIFGIVVYHAERTASRAA